MSLAGGRLAATPDPEKIGQYADEHGARHRQYRGDHVMCAEVGKQVGRNPPYAQACCIGNMVLPEPAPGRARFAEYPPVIYQIPQQGSCFRSNDGCHRYGHVHQFNEDVEKRDVDRNKTESDDPPSQHGGGKKSLFYGGETLFSGSHRSSRKMTGSINF